MKLEIKCRHRCSQAWFDDMSNFIQELLPQDNLMPLDFYSTKKLVRGLGLPVQVINCCVNNCMIYWGDESDLNSCKKCGHARYKQKVRGSGNRLYIRKLKVSYKKMHYFPITPRL